MTVRGILSGTFFAQDADFGTGNGQRAEYVTAERDKWVHGGDVRNMRLGLGITGPEVKPGWRVNANFEMDFFGANTAGGNFGDEQPQPRLRLAYVDLTNSRTTLRIGQDWSPTLGNIPQSTSHIGFPLGWGSGGFMGWRFMQIKLLKTLSRAGARTTTRVQLAVMSGSWTESAVAADSFSAGERGLPQVEARFDYSKASWAGYIVGHIDQKDIAGPDLTSRAIEVGVSTTRGDLAIAANGHYGNAMGHQFAQIVQFGDIQGWGAWTQLGYTLNPKWSVWGFVGTERPDEADITNNAVTDANGAAIALDARRFKSWLVVPMIRYKSGAYALGLEWLHNEVQVGPAANNKYRSGNQVALSARYDF
ncbi:MAG: hypothetical protein ACM358_12765 [Gemmatimonadota bacterium]